MGTVPHGGYVTSCFLSVLRSHFSSTRRQCDQPDTIGLQINFLQRTQIGPATFTVSDLKLGRRTSTVQVSLRQAGSDECLIVGYFTQSNLSKESGVTSATNFRLNPPPTPVRSHGALLDGSDPDWTLYDNPFGQFRKAEQHSQIFLSTESRASLSTRDIWMRFEGDQSFTQESLGYVADTFPHILETGRAREQLTSGQAKLPGARDDQTTSGTARFWYPTVLLNLDIKQLLPTSGVEWLFSRVQAKQIRNGRMDIEVVIMDERGVLIAISNHIALVMGSERNTVRNEPKQTEAKCSKI